jgi:hypothetical protein
VGIFRATCDTLLSRESSIVPKLKNAIFLYESSMTKLEA